MDIKGILKYNNSYAFRLAFFSIDFQDGYAKLLQESLPGAMMSKHMLTEAEKNLIDIDAVAGSLDISVEEVISQPVYEFVWDDGEFEVYLNSYFIYAVRKNNDTVNSLDEKMLKILSGLNQKPTTDVSPSSFTCIINVTAAKVSLEHVLAVMNPNTFPMLELRRSNGGRYVDSLNMDEDLNLDIIRAIEKQPDGDFLWRISMNENLFFQKMDQIDAITAYSDMFQESQNELVKLFK